MRRFILIILLAIASPAWSEDNVAAKAPYGGNITFFAGRIALEVNGKTTWSQAFEDAGKDGTAVFTTYKLAKDRTAVLASVGLEKRQSAQAIILFDAGKAKPKIIWQGITGLKGDIGERNGPAIRFDDLDGDSLPEIAIGQISESVRLCGLERLPLLFRKVYDYKSSRFRPTLARRPGTSEPIEIEGSFEPREPPNAHLINQVSPTSVSRAAHDNNEAFMLSPPLNLTDNDPTTAWTAGPGNGAGEFATFKVDAETYGITRVGIAAVAKIKRANRYDRPQTLLLTSRDTTYRLRFPSDPLEHSDQVAWFDIPRPLHATCFSLVVESSFVPSPKRVLTIADVLVRTEINTPDGISRLANDLNNPDRRRQAAMLLERIGTPALFAIRESWPSLDKLGRRRAVAVLTRTGDEGIDLLAEAAVGKDKVAAQTARQSIIAAQDTAIPPLAKFLTSENDGHYLSSVSLLGAIGSGLALDALVSAAGSGKRERRAHLRSNIALAIGQDEAQTKNFLAHLNTAADQNNRKALLDLLRAGSGIAGLTEQISKLAVEILETSSKFADRFRALIVLGRMGCRAPVGPLVAAASADDPLIRATAISAMSSCADHVSSEAQTIINGLGDKTPMVRIASLQAIGKNSDKAADSLKDLSVNDPWPEVRVFVARTAANLKVEEAISILTQAASDKSTNVREAALETAAAIQDNRINQIVLERLVDKDEELRLKTLAAFIAGDRCHVEALQALFNVLQTGSEPLAAADEISLAVSAATSMGAIGGKQAKDLLVKAKRRSNPATDKAIDEALKNLGTKCQLQ
jgi:HEAT repeat protein